VFTPAILYTKILLIIGAVIVFHMIYLMIGLVHSALKHKEGAIVFLIASVLVLITVVIDFLYYNDWSFIGNISPLGLLVFAIGQMLLLSIRFTRTAMNEERIANELKVANDKLIEVNMNLEKIVEERTHALSVAHDELRMSYEQLLHSEQGRKKLLAYITHDLRMPLSSMLGYVEAVQDKVKPERNEQYLKYIRDNTIRINRMIEELSFLSHLETGQVSYQMKEVSLIQFLQCFYEQYELVVRDAGIDFKLEMQGEAFKSSPKPIVLLDELRMEQALFNLVSNAMKFTPKGGIVKITLIDDKLNNDRNVIISVEDSGIGIPPDQLEQIFDRNYRYDQPGIENGAGGSGLGLAICREIVLAHKGTVYAESDGKTGAKFYMSLPYITKEVR